MMREWQPAEMTPEDEGTYLVFMPGRLLDEFSCQYFGKIDGWTNDFGISHWMPLPAPPNEAAVKLNDDPFTRGYAAGREVALKQAARICWFGAEAFDKGAGTKHSPEARELARAQATWCAEEIERVMAGLPTLPRLRK